MPYNTSFKHQILSRCRDGESVADVSKSCGVSRSTVYRWLNKNHPIEANEKAYSPHDIKTLERKIAKQEKIITILKTVPCTVHAPLKERLNALEQLHSEYDVHTLCEALNVARGTYYNHILRNKRDNVWYRKRDEEYRILVRDIFYEFDQILGAKKIHAVLQQRGHSVTRQYVARIMQELGLSSIRNHAKSTHASLHRKPDNILQQHFHTDAPNQIWISDVTCFKYMDDWFYICAIMDLYSRRIVGWHIRQYVMTSHL